jgi:uncharacterized protein YbaR (Trm112 family)/SAM-dependent methyltransferase
MKERVLRFLCCPDCRGERLSVIALPASRGGAGDEIEDGIVACGACASQYPVIRGIPRMLPRALRPCLRTLHPDFFRRHPALAPGEGPPADPSIVQTLFGYSFQHVALDDPRRETERWRQTFLRFLPVGGEFFAGKVGADIGCGAGRHLYWAHEMGAEVVGVDLSEGVEVARATTAGCPRAHVVQGDVHHLPLRDGVLDFAYSLGVLHFIPVPGEGVRHIVPALRPGASLFVWVYGLDGMRLTYRLSHLRRLRAVVRRAPRPVQWALSLGIAAGLEATVWAPGRALARVPGGGRLARRLPLADSAARPFRVKARSVFNRFQPPVVHYARGPEVARWITEAGCRDVAVQSRDGRGWVGSGVKSAG